MSKKNRLKSNNLSQILVYILGHSPFEFGLVPDIDGFIKYKDLLQAIHEEPGLGYVRQGNINEVLMGEGRSLFEEGIGKIRSIERRWAFSNEDISQLPSKILFLGIRRKAHPIAMDKGLRLIEGSYYILSADKEMAERIGRRRDPQPVILEVKAEAASREGLEFLRFGALFLVKEIPSRFIAGPLVPKSVIKAREEREAKRKEQETVPQFHAGTFLLDLEKTPAQHRRDKGRKKRGWKEEARKDRRTMRMIPR